MVAAPGMASLVGGDPMHLHGHAFRALSRNGMTVSGRPWRNTVLVDPQERMEVAFVADNPGRWMFHCRILEHQEGGMMGRLRLRNLPSLKRARGPGRCLVMEPRGG